MCSPDSRPSNPRCYGAGRALYGLSRASKLSATRRSRFGYRPGPGPFRGPMVKYDITPCSPWSRLTDWRACGPPRAILNSDQTLREKIPSVETCFVRPCGDPVYAATGVPATRVTHQCACLSQPDSRPSNPRCYGAGRSKIRLPRASKLGASRRSRFRIRPGPGPYRGPRVKYGIPPYSPGSRPSEWHVLDG